MNYLIAATNFKFSLLVAGLSSGWPPGWLQTLMEMFHIDFGKEIAFSENRTLDVSAQESQKY
jgi:hypothetical protein